MKSKQPSAEASHCYWCGKVVQAENILLRDGKIFCCEGCNLGDLAAQTHQQQQDETYMVLAESLVSALDAREHETGLHSKRVACHTVTLARQFTDDTDSLKQIYWGALLHDIGKIAIPDSVLLKQGTLTEEEWRIMRSHPQRGYDILAEVSILADAAQIVLCHEEHYDGNGYPAGLSAEDIPWGARLFAVIDTLDAITNDRPYRKGSSFEVAKKEIIKYAGQQFDPKAVEALLANEDELKEMVKMKCYLKPDFS